MKEGKKYKPNKEQKAHQYNTTQQCTQLQNIYKWPSHPK